VKQVTVVHQGALGDTVVLIPLFRSLRQRFAEVGGCAITVVTRMNLGQMLMMMGFVEAHASADDREHSAWFGPPEGGKANSMPAWAGADLLISAVSNGSDAWAENARRARQAMGKGGEGGGLCFFEPRPPLAPLEYGGHVTAWHREQLESQGLALEGAPLPLLRVNPDGAVVIHPGSGGDAKCWPREKFLGLAHALKRNGILPTLILGEAEQDRWGRAFVESLKGEFPWYLNMGFYELAERLSRARVYLGNDSGVTQLAAAVGVPVIALFGPSSDVQWRPVGPAVKVLRAEAPFERDLAKLEEGVVLGEMLAELRKL
jgi:ADP-heptose:LPS heptosyltransferase